MERRKDSVMRRNVSREVGLLLAIAVASPAAAQLRPLEPIPWDLFRQNDVIAADVGESRLFGQRASLAGTSGVLTELANLSLTWRTGRVALQAAGTAERVFHDQSRFADAYAGVVTPGDGRRHDAGDYRISTSVRLTPDDSPLTGVFRFGTRLPTTTDPPGLDRNATDFFATFGASRQRERLFVDAEGGVSIDGSRGGFRPQELFVYALHVGATSGHWSPTVSALGQINNHGQNALRGLESLGEARLGIRYSRTIWLELEGVRGYAKFSPTSGILITAGYLR